MLGRKPIVIIFTFILTLSLFVLTIRLSKANTITVPNDYYSIQAAINAANPGDTIFVKSGVYNEKLLILKPISLIGENRNTTIILGYGSGTIVSIGAVGVNITGFTIRGVGEHLTAVGLSLVSPPAPPSSSRNANVTGNIMENCDFGVLITSNSRNNTISQNLFDNIGDTAVAVYGSGNAIMENEFSNRFTGVYTVSISIGGSDNRILKNVIKGGAVGMQLLLVSSRNYFAHNSIVSSTFGFEISTRFGGSNILRNNEFVNNSNGFVFLPLPHSITLYIQDIDASNTIDGKPIYYLVNQNNMTVPENAAFVAVVNSTNVLLKNLNITHNIPDVIVAYSSDTSVQNVSVGILRVVGSTRTVIETSNASTRLWNTTDSIFRNNYGSIELELADHNQILNNTLNGALALTGSSHNVIENNSGNGSLVLWTYSSNPYWISSDNNTILSNDFAQIHIESASNNTITNNMVSSRPGWDIWHPNYGILLQAAENNTIEYNTITGANIGFILAVGAPPNRGNVIIGNQINNNTIGLMLSTATNNVFRDNIITASRYNFGGSSVLANDIDSSNLINGKHIYLLENLTDLIIDSSTYPDVGYLAFSNCTNVLVENLMLTNNVEGLQVWNSQNLTAVNLMLRENIVGAVVRGSYFNEINNSTIEDNQHGITLDWGSSNNTLSGNTITNNTYRNFDPQNPEFEFGQGPPSYLLTLLPTYGSGGVYLGSGNNTLASNIITNNERGITIFSANNTFKDTILSGNRYNIKFIDVVNTFFGVDQFSQDMDSSNLVEGKPVYFWVNQKDKEVPNDAGFVVLVNSTGILIAGVNISRNSIGIVLAGTRNVTITNVTVRDCLYGIDIGAYVKRSANQSIYLDSLNNIVTNSTLKNNGAGIATFGTNSTLIKGNILVQNMIGVWLDSSSHDVIQGNIIMNNTLPLGWQHGTGVQPFPEGELPYPVAYEEWGGVVLDGSSATVIENTIAYNEIGLTADYFDPTFRYAFINLIYHNNFINNTYQLYMGTKNTWDNGYPSGGNYWSDYTGVDYYSGPYQNITGSDGIGDTPYDMGKWVSLRAERFLSPQEIEALQWAKYPLMKPYPWAAHDLGITRITVPRTIITNDNSVPITIGVLDYGNFTETFTLTIQVNSNTIASYPNMTLTSHNSTTLEFSWNTTDLAKGNYTITAQITTVPGEADTADNTRTMHITITIPGDINGDFTVNNDDATVMQQSWQSRRGQTNYNPNADLNNSGKIDASDAALLGYNWGNNA